MSNPIAVILMYHRITLPLSDPWCLCVSPENFEQHLEVLKAWGTSLKVCEMTQLLRAGTLPDRSFAITFDDGYFDNYSIAKPLLERWDSKGTIFVVSHCLAQHNPFWWDTLEEILLHPGSLPNIIRIRVHGLIREWRLEQWANYTEEDYRKYCSWQTWQSPPTLRQAAYYSIWETLRTLSQTERLDALEELRASAQINGELNPVQTMTEQQAAALANSQSIEIGCHTMTHPRLSTLSSEEQCHEIMGSKSKLESILSRKVSSFAYPFGAREDFTAETESIVRESGFDSACSTMEGLVDRRSDLYQLPRLFVGNWDRTVFQEQLASWLL